MSFASCPVAFLLVLIVFFAIAIANVANLINTSRLLESYAENSRKWFDESNAVRIDDSTEHLMWFVQVNV